MEIHGIRTERHTRSHYIQSYIRSVTLAIVLFLRNTIRIDTLNSPQTDRDERAGLRRTHDWTSIDRAEQMMIFLRSEYVIGELVERTVCPLEIGMFDKCVEVLLLRANTTIARESLLLVDRIKRGVLEFKREFPAVTSAAEIDERPGATGSGIALVS